MTEFRTNVNNKKKMEEEENKQQITNNTNLTTSTTRNFTSLSSNSGGLTSINDDNNYRSQHLNLFNDNNSGFRSVTSGGLRSSSGGMRSYSSTLNTLYSNNLPNDIPSGPLFSNKKVMDQISQSIPHVNKKQEKDIKSKNLSTWIGPLHQFTTFKSECNASVLFNEIYNHLKIMCKEEKTDFMDSNYEFYGRMYTMNDMSEFQIQIYKNNDKNDKKTETILEIRRTSGDSFVHEELFNRITRELIHKNLLIKDNTNMFNDDFTGLPDLSFNNLSLNNDDDEDIDLDDNMTDNDIDMNDDDTNSTSITDNNDNNRWAEDMIDTLKDRQSYRDTWRHSATQLASMLKENQNKNMLQYVSNITNIIDDILNPITSDLYDTLIIKSVLEIIHVLLKNKVKPTNPSNVRHKLASLQHSWQQGPTRQLGPLRMTFTKSQQIVKQCINCLNVMNE